MERDIFNKDICPECLSLEFIIDFKRAEVVCALCGLVIDENIPDRGFGFNEFRFSRTDEDAAIENTVSFTLHDKGLPTMIDSKNKDIHGKSIPSRNMKQWGRLRKLDRKGRISGPYERNLAEALNKLNIQATMLSLPKTMREDASITYRKALDYKLIKGRGINKVVAASLYISCRRFRIPYTLAEIGELSGISKTELGRTYRFLTRELNIKLPLASPRDFVPRFASELELSSEVESKAIEIIEKAEERGLTSGQSNIMAAAALYAASNASGKQIRMMDVTDVAKVSSSTLKKRSEGFDRYLD
ncbi:TFIIB-type zinc ribbon-containing protein [Methanobrevibacter sp.]|uniref:TFIIB-type zinc ribbon-containing protein n=1 Tax=Methanobrevibacter sp. TaxID=66852 RepID=UPI0038646C6E